MSQITNSERIRKAIALKTNSSFDLSGLSQNNAKAVRNLASEHSLNHLKSMRNSSVGGRKHRKSRKIRKSHKHRK